MEKLFDKVLLVTDMDGTLLDDKKEISPKDIESIKFFKENGGKFTIATGRIVESTRRYAERIPVNFPVITYNGGKIFDYHTNKIINEYYLDENKKVIVDKVLSDELDVGIEVYVDEVIYI